MAVKKINENKLNLINTITEVINDSADRTDRLLTLRLDSETKYLHFGFTAMNNFEVLGFLVVSIWYFINQKFNANG